MIDVNALYVSIQGEGAMSGTPMIVLRLQGCGVGCVFCDTKETWTKDPEDDVVLAGIEDRIDGINAERPNWSSFDETELAEYIAKRWPKTEWVLVTGGEPAEQALHELVDALHNVFRKVALETSGTARGHLFETPAAAGPWLKAYDTKFDWVCLSPKIDNPAGKPILVAAVATADEFKFVIGKQADVDVVNRFLDRYDDSIDEDKVIISVQPMSQSTAATGVCVAAALEYNWRLSLQLHKYIGLP